MGNSRGHLVILGVASHARVLARRAWKERALCGGGDEEGGSATVRPTVRTQNVQRDIDAGSHIEKLPPSTYSQLHVPGPGSKEAREERAAAVQGRH